MSTDEHWMWAENVFSVTRICAWGLESCLCHSVRLGEGADLFKEKWSHCLVALVWSLWSSVPQLLAWRHVSSLTLPRSRQWPLRTLAAEFQSLMPTPKYKLIQVTSHASQRTLNRELWHGLPLSWSLTWLKFSEPWKHFTTPQSCLWLGHAGWAAENWKRGK